MNKQEQIIYEFMQSCSGSWRNCVFISCKNCPYGQSTPCPGFLFTAHADGKPLLLSIEQLYRKTGDVVDPLECVAVLDRRGFEAAFARWLLWQVDNPNCCTLQQLST